METQFQPSYGSNYGNSYNNSYGNSYGSMPIKPNDYKLWSIIGLILSVICCCNCNIVSLILSILALVKSFDVQKYYEMGEAGIMQAKDASEKAKLFNIISYIFLVIWLILGVIYWIVNGFSAIMDML